MPDKGGRLDLGEENTRRLLIVLSQDDDVRARFEQDPAEVLRQYGIQFDATEIPGDVRLPSKEKIQADLQGSVQVDDTLWRRLFLWGASPPGDTPRTKP